MKFWDIICTFMNVNLYVYERKKCTLTSKRTLEHGIENTIFVAKCWDHEMWKISFCEPFLSSEEILEMRAVSVLGIIFLIFIEFEWPVLRSRVFARCATWNQPLGRENHFEHHFSEQGRSPCKTVSCRGGGRTPKRGPNNYLMGSNWLKASKTS